MPRLQLPSSHIVSPGSGLKRGCGFWMRISLWGIGAVSGVLWALGEGPAAKVRTKKDPGAPGLLLKSRIHLLLGHRRLLRLRFPKCDHLRHKLHDRFATFFVGGATVRFGRSGIGTARGLGDELIHLFQFDAHKT